MKWPWQKQPENRGTLTLLPGSRMVLGFPHGHPLTQETASHLRQQLREWVENDSHRVLVFPFPLDVVDKR